MAEIKVCECGSAHWADKQCPECAPTEKAYTQAEVAAAIAAERAYWKHAMSIMLVARSGQVTDMDLAERLAMIVANDRSNVEFSGGAPLYGAAFAGTKGYTSGGEK